MPVAPPRPKDLPMTALRAFEAAARLGGFAAAATELGVTPGAVTAHVKALEDRLGAALFERTAKGVRLTALGARVLPDFTAAFDALGLAVHHLRAEAAPQVVHIATLPAIAQLWLSPRLPGLRAQMPEVAISITAMEAPPNLKRAPYDLSLFYGDHGQQVARDHIFPVCAPALAARITTAEDLHHLPCLIDSAWSRDWASWAAVALPGQDFTPRGPVFSLYALAVEEAANGAGVLMAHGALVAGHLARGTLMAPLPQRVALPQALRLWSARPLRPGQPAERVARALQAGTGDQIP
ncbi:MAG: LysR family transcriptional regulator [Rhodobacteraceae bacterium GWE1_64_9]|nr:MAG: LysR family transcriptional regulator [Rhodobacteraceae bacterium GWE1_64_9]OHC50205.1 MAG: LysR family transcriptional regulator [Rhodobacteraceae bacterium GWF1_65_7]HBD91331.1 LysR family transcriptional regulator [Gemmobacter sp.]HBU15254.1 LysR family transcriptional regulator [Gemmobacter sp.]